MAMLSALGFKKFSTFKMLRATLAEPLKNTSVRAEPNSVKMWKNIFFLACIPALILCGINVYLQEEKARPEFIKYPYLRIRKKPFPWGDGNKTLFHNPHTNALPDGYEDSH